MSEMAKKAREAMKEKAQGRAAPTKGSIDASGWTEPTMNTTAKVGMRPISRRQFKKGGKVEGEAGVSHAGKRPRKTTGGYMSLPEIDARAAAQAREAKMRRIINDAAGSDRGDGLYLPEKSPYVRQYGGRSGRANGGKAPVTPDSFINRDAKEANEARGYPHTGGYKKGGKADGKWIQSAIKHPGSLRKALNVKEGENIPAKKLAKATHSENPKLAKRARLAETLRGMHAKGGKVHEDEAMDKKLIKAEMAKHEKGCRCAKCYGGRTKKEGGGALDYLSPVAMAAKNPKMLSPLAMAMGKKKGGSAGNYEGGTRPTGGRIARKDGGRTKGKTHIHININAGAKPQEGIAPPMGLPGPMPRPPMPVAPSPLAGGAGMPPMGVPPSPMGGALPPGLGVPPPAMGPMARKAGGRVGHRGYSSYKDMDAGSGSGLGRLEKTEIEKKKG